MTEVMSVADVLTDTINDTENANDIDDANETENMTDDKNHEEDTTGLAECVTEEVEMKDVADKPKKTTEREETTGRARKRERVHKTNDANITQVDNMNDVADESLDADLANMSEVALKQEVRDITVGFYVEILKSDVGQE